MKYITKRKDGRWMGRKVINGNRVCVYGRTKADCYEKLKSIKKQNIQPKQTIKQVPTSFYKFALYWFENFKKGSIVERSHKFYLQIIESKLKVLDKNIRTITLEELQTFVNSLPPTRTREKCVLTIKQVFKTAMQMDLIKKDISQYIVKGRIEKQDIQAFTLAEQKSIVAHLEDNEISKIILTYLLTGCRPQELFTLRKSKVDRGQVFISGTKSKNAKRWVKISNKLESILKSREEVLFDYSLQQVTKMYKEFLQEIGVKGTLYQLRHTFATNLYYLRVPDKERQVYMGHYSTSITNDIYTDFNPNISREDIINIYGDFYPDF